ncbi:MAG: GNAT family N-acetyltransferase [Thermoleophilia bacterium]
MPLEPLVGPEPLDRRHELEAFRCGAPALDAYLRQRALTDQRAEKSRTYVATRGGSVVAYFSLAAASIEPADATARLAKGQGRQLIPVILLARLAVDLREQGHRLGEAMLVDALHRCARAADTIGARAVLVHAKNEQARAFNTRYGFEPSPTHPLHLVVLMKDVRASLRDLPSTAMGDR